MPSRYRAILLAISIYSFMPLPASAQQVPDNGTDNKRYDVQAINYGAVGDAVLIDRQTGKTWILRAGAYEKGWNTFHWEIIPFAADPN